MFFPIASKSCFCEIMKQYIKWNTKNRNWVIATFQIYLYYKPQYRLLISGDKWKQFVVLTSHENCFTCQFLTRWVLLENKSNVILAVKLQIHQLRKFFHELATGLKILLFISILWTFEFCKIALCCRHGNKNVVWFRFAVLFS